MRVKWTLTDDSPVFCLGLYDTLEEAQEMKARLKVNVVATPIIMDDEED